MSRNNKVNKSNYVQGGRLTPDEMARERKRQAEVSAHAKGKERVGAKAAPARAASRRRSEREE
jgi:hypothetical protein